MEFLGIGAGEFLVILLIALIALGPERLPEVADQLGRSMAWLRQVSDEITRSVSAELAVPKRQAWKPQSGPGPAAEPEGKVTDSETEAVEPQEGAEAEESSQEEEESS